MSRPLRSAAAISVVGVIAFGGVARAAVDSSEDGTTSGQAKATVTGNPFTSNINSAPPPVPLPVALPTLPPLPVPVPTALPALPATPVPPPHGASSSDHVYVTTTSAQPVSYAVAAFALPAGLQPDQLTVSFSDDGAVGEDVSADTAALVLCPLTAPLNAAAPDDPAAFDCTQPATLTRAATSSGGTWTGDASSLVSHVTSSGVFGVAVVPLATSATSNSSVAILRNSFSVSYHGTALTSPIGSTVDSTISSATGASPAADLPVAEAPALTGGGPTASGTIPAPMTAGPAAQSPPLATQAQTTSADDRWRPLLLLLVPAVPILVLAIYRRTREAVEVSDEDLLRLYPGLAQLLN